MRSALALVGFSCTLVGLPLCAHAQSTIRQPGNRPHYSFELEPELVLGPFEPPGAQAGDGYGAGVRGTIEIAPDGFLPKLNDSVGIGFGFDYLSYPSDPRGECTQFVTGAAGTRVCTATSGGSAAYLYFPVVLQWNFWLHRKWSVFGEPGVALYYHRQRGLDFSPFVIEAGGRYHFSDAVALTLRVGYPMVSLGVSFLL
jgi:hypothetical protein